MAPARSLFEVLTDQIVAGQLSVEDAREIVLRREFYRRKTATTMAKLSKHDAAIAALEQCHGHHGDAARELDISRATLYRRIACAA